MGEIIATAPARRPVDAAVCSFFSPCHACMPVRPPDDRSGYAGLGRRIFLETGTFRLPLPRHYRQISPARYLVRVTLGYNKKCLHRAPRALDETLDRDWGPVSSFSSLLSYPWSYVTLMLRVEQVHTSLE